MFFLLFFSFFCSWLLLPNRENEKFKVKKKEERTKIGTFEWDLVTIGREIVLFYVFPLIIYQFEMESIRLKLKRLPQLHALQSNVNGFYFFLSSFLSKSKTTHAR